MKVSVAISLSLIALSSLISAEEEPPWIEEQPPNHDPNGDFLILADEINNYRSEPLKLPCDASGDPAPKFRWTKNGKPFDWKTQGDRIRQVSNKGTLIFDYLQDDDEGYYQCFAYNKLGTAMTNSVFVRKEKLPPFTRADPLTVEAQEGKPVKLSCSMPAGSPSSTVFWEQAQTNGAILVDLRNNTRMAIDPEGNLHIFNVTKEDAAEDILYRCVRKLRFISRVGTPVHLKLTASDSAQGKGAHEPVVQYVSKETQEAMKGDKVVLYCAFGGIPPPQVSWSKDGQNIEDGRMYSVGSRGQKLVINSMNMTYEGKYSCSASNGVGGSKSHIIYLKLKGERPSMEKWWQHVMNEVEGGAVEFSCTVESGVPEPKVQWIHNGKPLHISPPDTRRQVMQNNSLLIYNLRKQDIGNYGCNVSNIHGYRYREDILLVHNS